MTTETDTCTCAAINTRHCPIHGQDVGHPKRHRLSLSGFRGPVTMAMAEDLKNAGYIELSVMARRYATDRPHWWRRVR